MGLDNLPVAPPWFGPAVGAAVGAAVGPAVAAAVGPAVAAALIPLRIDLARGHNRTSLSLGRGPLMPVPTLAGAVPPAFPNRVEQWVSLEALASAHPNAAIVDLLLNFYGIVDPANGVVFPMVAPALPAAPAAADAEVRRKLLLLVNHIAL